MSDYQIMRIKLYWRCRGIKFKLYKKRAEFRRRRRLYFPSPAEVQFIMLMGGTGWQLPWLRDPRTGFCFTIIKDMGTVLTREMVRREVRVGAMYIDFAVSNKYYKKGIEIDGKAWHMDVLREQQRDDYVRQYGYNLLHIRAIDITLSPQIVQRRVVDFLQR